MGSLPKLIAISMGIKPDAISMNDLPKIREKLLAMKPNIKMVGDIVSVQNALVNGDVDMIINGAEFVVSGLTLNFQVEALGYRCILMRTEIYTE